MSLSKELARIKSENRRLIEANSRLLRENEQLRRALAIKHPQGGRLP